MRVLCEFTDCGPSFVRTGWGRVFAALGHEFHFWRPSVKPAFDVFNEIEPHLFIGTTYGLDRAQFKCIANRPEMKVILFGSAWGDLVKDLDKTKYPLVVTSEQEKGQIELLKKVTGKPDFVFVHVTDKYLEGTMGGWREIGVEPKGILNAADTFDYLDGRAKPELACDVAFVGGYWPYKARNLDQYMLPLCHHSQKLNVKIFGNQPWPVAQYLGTIETADVRDLFASAKVCPNVSEPHSTAPELGFDTIERPFKVLSSGGFCVSDYVPEAATCIFTNDEIVFTKTPKEFRDAIHWYVGKPEERLPYMKRGKLTVLKHHTYFNRVAQMFSGLGMEMESERCLALRDVFLGESIRLLDQPV